MLKTFCQYAEGDDGEWCQNAVNDVVPAGEAFLVEVLSDGVDEMFHCWDGFNCCAFRYRPAVGLFCYGVCSLSVPVLRVSGHLVWGALSSIAQCYSVGRCLPPVPLHP